MRKTPSFLRHWIRIECKLLKAFRLRIMSRKERRGKKQEESRFSVNASEALRIALEDSETSYFIKTNFSYPEQSPEIVSRKWISSYDSGYKWNVEIIERISNSALGIEEMVNVAVVELDSSSGRILRRQFFKNIFTYEYQKIIDLLLR